MKSILFAFCLTLASAIAARPSPIDIKDVPSDASVVIGINFDSFEHQILAAKAENDPSYLIQLPLLRIVQTTDQKDLNEIYGLFQQSTYSVQSFTLAIPPYTEIGKITFTTIMSVVDHLFPHCFDHDSAHGNFFFVETQSTPSYIKSILSKSFPQWHVQATSKPKLNTALSSCRPQNQHPLNLFKVRSAIETKLLNPQQQQPVPTAGKFEQDAEKRLEPVKKRDERKKITYDDQAGRNSNDDVADEELDMTKLLNLPAAAMQQLQLRTEKHDDSVKALSPAKEKREMEWGDELEKLYQKISYDNSVRRKDNNEDSADEELDLTKLLNLCRAAMQQQQLRMEKDDRSKEDAVKALTPAKKRSEMKWENKFEQQYQKNSHDDQVGRKYDNGDSADEELDLTKLKDAKEMMALDLPAFSLPTTEQIQMLMSKLLHLLQYLNFNPSQSNLRGTLNMQMMNEYQAHSHKQLQARN